MQSLLAQILNTHGKQIWNPHYFSFSYHILFIIIFHLQQLLAIILQRMSLSKITDINLHLFKMPTISCNAFVASHFDI